jgi:hypothetical protein
VDAASDYEDGEDVIRLAGARDVAEFALASGRANRAFIEQLFQYLVKQPPRAFGNDTTARLHDSFVASGHDFRQLMANIATVAALAGDGSPTPTPSPAPHESAASP